MKKYPYKYFAKYLKSFRLRAELSLEDVQFLTDISVNTLKNYESGEILITSEHLDKLCKLYIMPYEVSALLEFTDDDTIKNFVNNNIIISK